MSVKIVTSFYVPYRALKYIRLNCIINYWSKLFKLKYMHHIFKKNYNLIIKSFAPMCLRRERYYPSHIAVLHRLCVIRVKLWRTEKQPRAKFNRN